MKSMMSKLAIIVSILATLVMAQQPAAAHESRPLYIELTQNSPDAWRVAWKIPPSLPTINLPHITLTDSCTVMGDSGANIAPDTYEGARLINCAEPLAGSEIQFSYPVFNPSVSTMIKMRALNGEEYIGILGPQEPAWRIPDGETASGVAREYMRIGVEHIWKGWDHLLFLVCLLWIAGDFRRVLITITGFTLAHSITLALSALEIVRLPIPPVEAAIALSIVFLAREIILGRRNSLTWNHPIAVSSSFGLLHGLGFAAVLGEIGLPQTQLITGLLFFNVGVEIGQLIFIAAVAMIFWILSQSQKLTVLSGRPLPSLALLRTPAAYLAGVVSCFWLVERIYGFY